MSAADPLHRVTGPRYGARGAARNRAAVKTVLAVSIAAAAALGLDGRANAKDGLHEGPRIVAIGDSLTAGYGLEQGTGFVPQLDAWLAEQGLPEAEVVDMGVSGDTTAGGRSRLAWALADGADAVIVALGGNDLLRGILPEASRENLATMLTELDAQALPVLLAGMQAPLNYGPEYKEAFDAMYPELAAKYDAILHPSFLAGLEDRPELIQPDGLHPNAEGVRVMVEAIGPRVLELIARVEPGAPAER